MSEDKSMFLDGEGRPLTQSLFLEIGYSPSAIYTLKEYDFEYEGRTLICIKQKYLEATDPTEYDFANKYFLGWKHWMRICENKVIRKHIDEWREELEVKLRATGVKQILAAASGKEPSFQAAKWIADKGWVQKQAGRPSKSELEREKRIQAGMAEEYSADVHRMFTSVK